MSILLSPLDGVFEINSENKDRLVLVSSSISARIGFVENSPIPELSEFAKEEIDYAKFIETIKNRVVISADDDDIVPYSYSGVLAKRLNARFRLLKTEKHFSFPIKYNFHLNLNTYI